MRGIATSAPSSVGAAQSPIPTVSIPPLAQGCLFALQTASFLANAQRRYGDVFKLRVAGMGDLVVIADPENVKEVLTGSPDTFLAGEANRRMLALCGQSSLLAVDGAEHLETRRRLLPALQGESVRAHEALIAQLTAERLQTWPIGKPISMYSESRKIMSEVILRAVLGVHDSPLAYEVRRILAKTMSVTLPISLWYMHNSLALVPPWRSYAVAVGRAHELIDELIAARESENLEGRHDILSLLIRAGTSDREWLRHQMMTLIVAGQDTMTSGLSWAVELLARHPRAQTLARERKGAYVDGVVTETLRLRTVLPGAARKLAGPAIVGPYLFPASSTLIASALLMSRDSRIYETPHDFRPDRWLDKRPGTYTWLPFGGGRRRCIGAKFAEMELRVALSTMLTYAHWRAVGREPEKQKLRLSLIPARGALIVRTR
jgi:cytochrome P450